MGLIETDPAVLLRGRLDDLVVELGEEDIDVLEQTVVREMPLPPAEE
jgi:hypothetical protein